MAFPRPSRSIECGVITRFGDVSGTNGSENTSESALTAQKSHSSALTGRDKNELG